MQTYSLIYNISALFLTSTAEPPPTWRPEMDRLAFAPVFGNKKQSKYIFYGNGVYYYVLKRGLLYDLAA